MTERSVTGRGPIEDPPVDVREIAAADELLDALGRGAEVPEDDQLAGLLAAWRASTPTCPASSRFPTTSTSWVSTATRFRW